jgi:hypothetical protein
MEGEWKTWNMEDKWKAYWNLGGGGGGKKKKEEANRKCEMGQESE